MATTGRVSGVQVACAPLVPSKRGSDAGFLPQLVRREQGRQDYQGGDAGRHLGHLRPDGGHPRTTPRTRHAQRPRGEDI